MFIEVKTGFGDDVHVFNSRLIQSLTIAPDRNIILWRDGSKESIDDKVANALRDALRDCSKAGRRRNIGP